MNNRNLSPQNKGFLGEMVLQVRLIMRLMQDRRVNPFLKILPFAGIIYLIAPDLMIGPIDDTAVLFLGSYIFLELCPQHVVQEHLRALRGESEPGKEDHDVVDAEYHDLDD